MLPYRTRILVNILIISALLLSGFAALTYGQMANTQPCEACSMTVAADVQAHLKVVDSTGKIHYADCLMCAFKMLRTYGALNITVTCDWYGPNYPIKIDVKNFTEGNYVNSTIVNPSTALFIVGSCHTNRVVYNQTAADSLLANQGNSSYVTMMQKKYATPSDSPVITIEQAALKYAFVSSPDPTPTPSHAPTLSPTVAPTPTAKPNPSPTPTKNPTPTATPTSINVVTQNCEVCGMDVAPDAQAKYTIIDGNGTVHYAECYMCALNLINKYDQLTITSYCDWYGPNYTVTVQSSQFGKVVNVTPTTAMFLNGGSCVINRVAYNQTAADALLTSGFSMYTLPEQHYDLPSGTNVRTVTDATMVLSKNDAKTTATGPILLAAFGGAAVVALSVVAYKKFKYTKN